MNDEFIDIASRVRAAYTAKELKLVDRQIAASASIDPSDSEFLCTVGVPRVEQLEVSFNLSDNLPSLRDLLAGQKMKYSSEWPSDFRCLNEKYDIVMGIDNDRGGRVASLDLEGKYPLTFVNKNVRCFVGFLAECVLHWKRYAQQGVPEDRSYQMACEWMESIDKQGLNGDWWGAVLEEMRRYG